MRNCSLHRGDGERQHRDRLLTRAILRRHGLAVKKRAQWMSDPLISPWRSGRIGAMGLPSSALWQGRPMTENRLYVAYPLARRHEAEYLRELRRVVKEGRV